MCPQIDRRRRPSHRSRVLATATATTLRPIAVSLPSSRAGILLSRRIAAGGLAALGPVLRGTRVEPVRPTPRADATAPQVRGEWVRSSAAAGTTPPAVVLYLHGSGFAICSARTHRGITSRVAALTGLPVLAVDYRLAPRHRFPAAADDVRAAWDHLRAEGHERIVVAGDSAGGHLALDLALTLQAEGQPGPVGLWLLSPVLDLSFGLAARRERVQPDPMISAAAAARLIGLYAGGADPAHPRLRLPLAAAGPDFPPVLVQAGGAEMLAADAVECARQLGGAGVEVRLDVWPGQMHVFQAFAGVLPEARRALEDGARFVVEHAGTAASADAPQARVALAEGA